MAAPIERLDVPLPVVELTVSARREFAARTAPVLPECAHCGSRRGPWVPEPHDARYSNGAQALVCKDTCTPADPERHALDAIDGPFARLACQSDCCRTESGDPEWDAWLAQRIADNTAAWNAAHNPQAGGQA